MSTSYWPGSGARYDAPAWVDVKSEVELEKKALDAIREEYVLHSEGEEGAFGKYSDPLTQRATFQSVFQVIFKEAYDLLVERQRKYGPENIRQLGVFGVFSRLAFDKIERVKRSLNGTVQHGEVVLEDAADFADESLEDALLDIANYALILIALKRGLWGAPLA